MKDKSERQPWNPFPLASLSAGDKFDLSPAAITVLIYLAARTNYTGWTCVGHKRICHDLRRSKDFVTYGLQELYEKGVVKPTRRGRKGKEADSRIISQEVLPEEWRSSPEQLDQISNPEIGSNPEEQDHNETSSPAFPVVVLTRGVKPCSIEPTEIQKPNLQEDLSELVSGSLASLASTSDASHPDPTPTGNEEAFSGKQIEGCRDAIETCFDYSVKVSNSVVKRILVAHPDFRWDSNAASALKKLLTQYVKTGKSWRKTILSPDDLAFRWESPKTTGTTLYDQLMRALGRGPQEEILIETPDEDFAKKFEMTVEEGPIEKAYLDGEVDLNETEPEPETVEQTTSRCSAFAIYSKNEIPAVVAAFRKKDAKFRFYDQLFGYHNGKTWKLGNNIDEVESNCEADQRRAAADSEKELVPAAGP
jgi:hypothetical protein